MRTSKLSLLCTLMIPLASISQLANAATYDPPVFGPKHFTRSTGAPQTITANVPRCGTSPCQLLVSNGGTNGSNRISSATISLNGSPVIGPSDFNQQVGSIVRDVVLGSQNSLAVTLASKPNSFITVSLQCQASPVSLSVLNPGVSLDSSGDLLSAVHLANNGTVDATNVQVTAITLNGGTLTSPAALPFNLANIIPVNGSVVLNASFSGSFMPEQTYVLTVQGTYMANGSTYCFTISANLTLPPPPGSETLRTTDPILPITVTGAPFTPPLDFPPEDVDADANQSAWTVPTAPFEPGTPTPTATEFMPAPIGDPPEILFTMNQSLGITANVSGTAEPSGSASSRGVVFITANWMAAYSTRFC